MNVTASTLVADKAQTTRMALYRRAGAFLNSARVQLFGALATGILGAYLVRLYYEAQPDLIVSYDTTLIGTSVAVLLGFIIYRKVTSLPGTAALMNIIPAFTVSYLTIAALFFALRLDFSRQQFGVSFVAVVLFFFLIGYFANRLRRPTFGFVAGYKTDRLTRLDYVDWVRLSSPEEADLVPDLPIVADLSDNSLGPAWERFLAEAAISGRRVFNAKQLKESLEGQVEIEHLSENSFGHLAPDSIYAPFKFYLDFLTALAALIVLSPVLLLVAAAIRLDTPGPAIFLQERMGYRGRPFTIFKFRSMHVDGPAGASMLSAESHDAHRITRVGRIIRKTRIDELPQILNILLGEMSWIGPRPETLALSGWYETELPFYRYRHIVRPGITGWAQIKQGHVLGVDAVGEKLEYDFFYVKNFSVWLDILIVIHTVRVMLTGHGAR